jgi:hypothetical protein
LPAHQPAEHPDHLEDLLDASLVEGDDRNSPTHQFGREIRLQIGKRQNEIRCQRLDLVEAGVDERRHFRLQARFRRADGVARHSHHPVPLAEQVKRFGGFLGEADDAFRIRGAHRGRRSAKT